ncbi:TatD family hydrolase [Candidatus Merdisoma sp. JLR.KK006]|uniref:TatD family hydrolase n=1 Tax=Candidatus Merdisoma sp. JLR.KK006 TaxID=3112626 RepID=UPI002FF0B966
MIFESHAHYDDTAFDADREALLKQCQEQGIETIVNVSASLASVKSTLQLAEQHAFIYAAVGIHPDEVGELNEEAMGWLREQCLHPKTVAVGEIGLDYYWDKEKHELQKYWFHRQMELAKELKLPIIVHSREAAADTLEAVRKAHTPELKGVIHCFSYTPEIAKEYLNMGYYIGIGGVITFKNAKKLKEVVKMLPLERILLETDCPYLAPEPYRGKRNSSLNLPYVAETIGQLKGVAAEEVIRMTAANARALYFGKSNHTCGR